MRVSFNLKNGKEIERYFYFMGNYPDAQKDENIDGTLEDVCQYLTNKGHGGHPICGFEQSEIETITADGYNDDKPMSLDKFYDLISGCLE